MANHKSALKRARQALVRRDRNRAVKTRIKNVVKAVREAAEAGESEDAANKLVIAQSVIDKAAKKGVIHKKTAGRKISRLNMLVNKKSAAPA